MIHTVFVLHEENGKLVPQWHFEFLSKEFQEAFDLVDMVYPLRMLKLLNDNRRGIKPKSQRSCRFCGKSYPEVTFKNRAHTIPELLGNKVNFSDFECDSCNLKFGTYENDLANYLGPYRTIAEIPGKHGIPKYKSYRKEMTIEQAFNGAIDIRTINWDDSNKILSDPITGITRVVTKGVPYSPINVFKCLLKAAISLTPEADLTHLSKSIAFLQDENYEPDPVNDWIFTMHQYFTPGNFNNSPFAVYFKKGAQFEKVAAPSLIFVLYVKNLVLQIAVPFHDQDSSTYDPRFLYIIPPLIQENWFKKYGGPFSSLINLNRSEPTKITHTSEWKTT